MPEDSGSKYNPSDTLSEETIVSDVDEEVLMEAEPQPDIETERPKANKGKRLEPGCLQPSAADLMENNSLSSSPLHLPIRTQAAEWLSWG